MVAATGPWSHLASYHFVKPAVTAVSSLSHKPAPVAPIIFGLAVVFNYSGMASTIALFFRALVPVAMR